MNNWKDKIREVTNVCYCHHNSGKELADEIIPIVTSLLEEQKKEFIKMIVKEIRIAQDEGKPTSRLTSLYNKLNK